MATKTKAKNGNTKGKKIEQAKVKKVTKAQESEKDDLRFLQGMVRGNFSDWVKSNPTATLGDLLDFLNEVKDEMLSYDDDEVLDDIMDELGVTSDYLAMFNPHETEEPCTVSYRYDDLEEDIRFVTELIELMSDKPLVIQLPKREFKRK